MRNKILIPLLITGALAAFFSFKYIAKDDAGNVPAGDQHKSEVIRRMMGTIKEVHFSPRTIDDTFSVHVFKTIMDELSYSKLFFTQQEMARLNVYKYKIDDELNAASPEFFDTLNAIYTANINRAEKYYLADTAEVYTFTGNDHIELNNDKLDYAADEAAQKERWHTFYKYRVLSRYVELKDAQAKATDKKAIKTDAQLEVEASRSVAKNQEYVFKQLRKRTEDQRFADYMNAIAHTEDPHTDYFPPVDKKRFDEQMSGSFIGIGAQLKPDEGKIKVEAIITGAPAWKEGELKAGDEIIKVAQGPAEPEDVQGFDLDEVVKRIRGDKGSEVRLTVKKVDGSTKVIGIIRGEVSLDETFAKSAIIQSKGGPIGYIYLPEFYADFNHLSGRRCATDVANEVMKLKAANVSGIILDLRNNGGGSLSDVVDMAGLFAGPGPVVQVKSSDAAPMVLKANNQATLYDGPMAIMVNQGSASASEIMAAALQDYKRAVIVGSTTYGKGTVQKVLPLDETDLFGNPKLKDGEESIGSLKVTMQKFYRINGGSTQLRGVTPDIMLPDIYKYIDIGERDDKAALKWDDIPAAKYKTSPTPNYPNLVAESRKRVSSNPIFNLIDESARRMKAQKDDDNISLNEVAYRKDQEAANATSKKLEELQKKGTPFTIVNLKDDMARVNADSISMKKNSDWIKNLQKDIYITETVNIVNDIAKTNRQGVTVGKQ